MVYLYIYLWGMLPGWILAVYKLSRDYDYISLAVFLEAILYALWWPVFTLVLLIELNEAYLEGWISKSLNYKIWQRQAKHTSEEES